jgi:UPF0755 protein
MKISMRSLLNFFLFSLTAAIVIAVTVGYWLVNEYTKPGPLKTPMIFEVQRGQNATDIAAALEAQGVINSAFVFKTGLKYIDSSTFLKAGEYELEPGMSIKEVTKALQSGRIIQYQITLPECITSFEVMNTLNKIEGLEGHIVHPPPEGSVYPNTYNYIRGERREDILLRMQKEMDMVLETAWRLHSGKELPFTTPKDALVLASIVEKEAGNPLERPKVAGLFLNRLKMDMRLQSDPTVIYGIVDGRPKTDGEGPLGRRLLKKDLEFDSPYNTYIYSGLPPGPICNPGKASIEAVLNPEDHDYIYMVADGTGGHAFATTLREHNNNVAKWRKIRASGKVVLPDHMIEPEEQAEDKPDIEPTDIDSLNLPD